MQALRGAVWESAAATLRLNDEREATREAQNRSLYTRVTTLRESLARQDVALAQMTSSLGPGEEPDEVLQLGSVIAKCAGGGWKKPRDGGEDEESTDTKKRKRKKEKESY